MQNPSATIPCVIIAGGQGRRLGVADKFSLLLDHRSILDIQLERLRPQCSVIYLNHEHKGQSALPLIRDRITEKVGPLGGLHAALTALGDSAHHVLTIAGDTPFIPRTMCDRLHRVCADEIDVAYCRSRGRDHFINALWSSRIYPQLESYLTQGERSVRGFIEGLRSVAVEFDVTPVDPFFNINTPAQWQQAQSMVRDQDL